MVLNHKEITADIEKKICNDMTKFKKLNDDLLMENCKKIKSAQEDENKVEMSQISQHGEEMDF